MKVSVFLFHRVSPNRDPLWDPMDPELFRRFIRWCKKKYEVITIESLYEGIQQKTSKPLAAINFDDGYLDFLQYAFPILREEEVPSSMYVITDSAETGLPPWTYRFDHAVLTCQDELQFQMKGITETVKLSDPERAKDFGKRAKKMLKSLPDNKRREKLQEFLEIMGVADSSERLMMNWDEIKQIANMGVVIGSHTQSHALLAKYQSEADIQKELTESAAILKEKLNSEILTISYPVGSYDYRVMKIAKACGYKFGLITDQRLYDTEKDDVFAIPRMEIYNESFLKARLRAKGFIEKMKKFRP